MDRGSESIVISYFIKNITPLNIHVFEFIFNCLKINAKLVDNSEIADVIYGTAFPSNSQNKQVVIIESEKDFIWKELIDDNIEFDKLKIIGFDIINAIGFFISDECNSNAQSKCFDTHGRLKFKHSFQYLNGIDKIPIVNVYICFLKRVFEHNLGVNLLPLLPYGKKACVILSHDVDIPIKHNDLFNYKTKPIFSKKFLKKIVHFPGNFKEYILDKNRNEFWVFKQLYEAEKQFGFKSTSFFASVSKSHKQGHQLDVNYSITKNRFLKLFKFIKELGFEIGLHASYNAYQSVSNFNYQKNILETVSDTKVMGLRHHFWHLGADIFRALEMHERASFVYDSSSSFNDNMGFRHNVALPFNPFDVHNNKKIGVLQIPNFCMDTSVFNDNNVTKEIALERIASYIDTLKKYNGVASIDWHIRNSYPGGLTNKVFGDTYLDILKYLYKEKEIWVTSFEEFYKWWTVDRSKLESI